MKLLLRAQNLTQPTVETIREYSEKKFRKLVKYFSTQDAEPRFHVRVNYEPRKKEYIFKVIMNVNSQSYIVNLKVDDPRRGVVMIENALKNQLLKTKYKSWLNDH